MLGRLAVIVALMFGFGYALVPLYQKICEVTGVNVLTRPNADAPLSVVNSQIDASRVVTVEFDANVQGPWRFQPEKRHVTVHPGELVHINYQIQNNLSRATLGQAIPSYAPQQASPYFRKLECFCFREQPLASQESKTLPVVFVIDPALPKNIHTITLSYTFFEVGGSVKAGAT
jgi:cytochrome c oxidase assembly protein subunit 11